MSCTNSHQIKDVFIKIVKVIKCSQSLFLQDPENQEIQYLINNNQNKVISNKISSSNLIEIQFQWKRKLIE